MRQQQKGSGWEAPTTGAGERFWREDREDNHGNSLIDSRL